MKKKVNLKQTLKNLKQRLQNRATVNRPNIKINKHNAFTLAALAFLVIAHIVILLTIIRTWRYYPIYPSLFMSAFGIVICSVIVIDIIFFVGFNHKDLALKVISTVLAFLLMIAGTVGAHYIGKTNTIVNNVLDDGKSDKYETYSGVFVCYSEKNNFKSLQDLSGKRVGLLLETSDGITYLANKALSEAKIDFAQVDYKTNAELMQALIDGDVDAIAITSAYRTIYASKESTVPVEESTENAESEEDTSLLSNILGDSEEETESEEPQTEVIEESPFAKYLDRCIDFYSFEEELKVNTTRSTKNISKDPFNVLLIGYSRTDIGSPVGLADSIILTTINPQTYTVSMTSIARDSFVPIPCYNGEYDKINSGRSTSRACFIETVEEFIGMDIDYYMELDYLGLVQIVNAIGGIMIDNPVEFTLDGIYVPAGHVFADGQMALQFCRERHHMPGGDFDRQQHQKEVIIAIAKKFIESGDITLALNAMDEASEWMSTDLTLTQLTNIFNLLLNTRNYTSLDTFDLVDFQNTRITGNGGMLYYSYSMRLPLWVYLIYKGSYNESMSHIKNVMGTYDSYKQVKNINFNLDNEYVRPQLFSTDYANDYVYTPDPMPAYWIDLEGYSLASATSWANANGVSLTVKYINLGDPGFNGDLEGLVVGQSARYGSLVSEYPSGTITVMGKAQIDESKQVPDFVEHSYSKAVEWARTYGIPYSIDFDEDADGKVGDVVSQSPKPYTDIDEVDKLRIVVKAGVYYIDFNKNGHGSTPDSIKVKTGDDAKSLPNMSNVTENGTTYKFTGWYTESSGGSRIYSTDEVSGGTTLYAHWEDVNHVHEWVQQSKTDPTCETPGKINYVCKHDSSHTMSEDIPALGHDWEITKAPTCGAEGTRKCKRCGKTESVAATGAHTWGDWITDTEATIDGPGSKHRVCSVCGASESQEIPAIEKCNDESASNYGQAAPCVYPEPEPETGGEG